MTKNSDRTKRTWKEEIEVNAQELVFRIRELIREGNVRHLVIKKESGELLLEIPLGAGVVAGGLITLAAPVLAALGAMAAWLTRVRVEIVRTDLPDGSRGSGGPTGAG